MKKGKEMRDILGRKIKIGDVVVFALASRDEKLYFGIVKERGNYMTSTGKYLGNLKIDKMRTARGDTKTTGAICWNYRGLKIPESMLSDVQKEILQEWRVKNNFRESKKYKKESRNSLNYIEQIMEQHPRLGKEDLKYLAIKKILEDNKMVFDYIDSHTGE